MVRVFASCLRGCCCYCLVVKSCLTLCDPWTVAHQASLSMGFPSKNTGVDCHFLLQGIFLTPGWNPHLSPALAGGFFTTSATWEAPTSCAPMSKCSQTPFPHP